MTAPQYHDTHEIVIAATLWLMHRYQQTGCKKLARRADYGRRFASMVERHLRWMENGAASPQLADACRRLSFEWRAASCTPHDANAAARTPPCTEWSF